MELNEHRKLLLSGKYRGAVLVAPSFQPRVEVEWAICRVLRIALGKQRSLGNH